MGTTMAELHHVDEVAHTIMQQSTAPLVYDDDDNSIYCFTMFWCCR